MRLVLLLFTAGRASADGFHAGDAWRGTMTNCQQSPHMLRRAVRYVAIELSVLAVDDRKVEVQFQNHAQKDMSYKLHGEYDPSQRRLHLRAGGAAHRGSPGSRPAVVFRISCGAYLRGSKNSGSQWAEFLDS